MASPVNDSYAGPSAGVIAGGRSVGIERRVLVPDGIYTWCDTTVTAVYRNGATYIGWVDKGGYSGITKFTHASGAVEHVRLSSESNKEVDDHNMTSLHFRPDGRIVAFYGPHNSSAMLYKVSLMPESITSWGPENVRGVSQGAYSYPYLTRFSQAPDLYFFISRRWLEGTDGATRVCSYRVTNRLDGEVGGAAPDPWSQPNDIWRVDNKIPYWQYASDGVNTLHVFATDMHPVQGQSSLYHFYLRLDASNVPRYYTSTGSEIPAPPVTPATATRIYDGAMARCWVSDAAVHNGTPVVLWMRYPQNDYWPNTFEYWYSRFENGSWRSVMLTTDGPGLYSTELYYHGGLQFDANDPSIVYLSSPIAGNRQIQEWRTKDNGENWSLSSQITSGYYTGLRARPYSPRNHNGQLKVIWWEGRYTTFIDYDTSIMGGR